MKRRIVNSPLQTGYADDPDVLCKPLKISSRQIQLLNALDQFRNMRRAALAMHTTQPAASLLLQQLEARLRVKLFERLSRGMEPTLYGEVLIRYARGVAHDFEHAETEIAELIKGNSGLVRIGSVIGPIPQVLTRSLLSFKAENPLVQISIDVGTSDTLIPHLIQGDLDLLLGRLPDRLNTQDLEIDFFGRNERMSIIARPGHWLTRAPKIKLSNLSECTWILHPMGSPMRSRVETALRKAKITSRLDIVETASLFVTTSIIEASDMISVVPADVALHYARYGMVTILPVELPISMVNLGVVTRKSSIPSPAVLKFLAHIKQNT